MDNITYEKLINAPWVDDNGRRHVCFNGMWFMIQNKGNFVTWLERSTKTSYDEFMRLRIPERMTIFLRWKHGLSDTANSILEDTEKDNITLIKRSDFSRNAAEYRYWASNMLKFHRYCQQVMRQIGLLNIKLDKHAEHIIHHFGGRAIATSVS